MWAECQPSWDNFGHMLMRTWFEQVWVIQEAASAQTVIVLCGSKFLHIAGAAAGFATYDIEVRIAQPLRTRVRDAVGNILAIDLQKDNLSQYYLKPEDSSSQAQNYRSAASNDNVDTFLASPVETLSISRSVKSTDLKDRIYALLGLLQESDIFFIPDYDLTGEEVFIRTAIVEIVNRKRLNFLSCTTHNALPMPLRLPSWARNWSLPPDYVPYVVNRDDVAAAGDSLARTRLSTTGDVLIVRGKILSHIETIGILDGVVIQDRV